MQKNTGLLLCCAAFAILVTLSACTAPQTKASSTPGFSEYRNATEGVRFEIPDSWQVQKATSAEHPDTVSFRFSPPDGSLMASLQTGNSANLANSPATLEQWRDQIMEMLPNATFRTDYKLVASEPATLSGSPAWRIEYTALMNNGPRMRGEVFLVMNGTRGTMLALVGNDDQNGVLSYGPQHFVRSVEITG